MTVHFFTFSDANGGSSRQRAFRVAEELTARGYTIDIHTPPILDITRTPWPKRFSLLVQIFKGFGRIKKDDIVFLQRAIPNKYFFVGMWLYLLVTRRRMIFDIDDPYYVHSHFKTVVFSKLATAIVTCTHRQAEWARQYNKHVTVIHIALAMPVYEKYTHTYRETDTPIIGWTGTGPEHLKNLTRLKDVFVRLIERGNASFTFTLVGSLGDKAVHHLFAVDGLTVKFIERLDWTDSESTPREIQNFDIGVVPHQTDGEWNQAKSSFKVLEYMACGVATIATQFGEMPYIITDGKTGLLAADEDEWVEKLEALLLDTNRQKELGKAGQERVREAYCYDATIPLYEEVLQFVQSQPR